jgi:N6-adenosine-specific RNA methylase IME4
MRKEARTARAKAQHAKVIEHGCTVDDLVVLAASGKRFGVVYADPAWPWETWSPSGRLHSCATHYDTSSIDEITKLPIGALAADDCALFLWATGPHIAVASQVRVIEAWGFRPSTIAFVWIKTTRAASVVALGGKGLHVGQGYSSRSNAEFCFLATKGSPLRLVADVHQIVMAPVAEHSAKPEEVRRRIERLFPGPFLELYACRPAPGWSCWGDEIGREQFLVAAE